jgi:TonB family protein
MEYIDGVALDALLKATGPPSIDLCLEVAQQALHALQYLHEKGFIHRDISPDNLMLARDEGRVRVKLIDLGIAKDLAEKSGVTAAGTFLGKVKYCAPELFKDRDGATNLDQRSDNYSLGVTLYELATGVYPFDGDSFERLAAAHLFHPPRSFEETDPEGRIPEGLREVILSSLAKDPDERPATSGEFAKRLEAFPPDEAAMGEEVTRTVEETARFLSQFKAYRSPGSTQDHLDAQFGMQKTGVIETADVDQDGTAQATEVSRRSPAAAATATQGSPATQPGRVPWLLAAGGLAIAAAALFVVWLTQRSPAIEPVDDPGVATTGALPGARSAEDATDGSRAQETGGAEELTFELAEEAVDVPPRPVQPIEPDFPKPDNEEVVVVVAVFVDAHGDVTAAEVKSGPTFRRRYREAALVAVEGARFLPGTKGGEPAEMWVDVIVRFKP